MAIYGSEGAVKMTVVAVAVVEAKACTVGMMAGKAAV